MLKITLFLLILVATAIACVYFSFAKEDRPPLLKLVGNLMDKESVGLPGERDFNMGVVASLSCGVLALALFFGSGSDSAKEQSSASHESPLSSSLSKAVAPVTTSAAVERRSSLGMNASDCRDLAGIGADALTTKQDGISLNSVLAAIATVDIIDPRRRVMAEGVVIAVYGDSTLKTRSQAYEAVLEPCMNAP